MDLDTVEKMAEEAARIIEGYKKKLKNKESEVLVLRVFAILASAAAITLLII